jgi:hypothetical protein
MTVAYRTYEAQKWADHMRTLKWSQGDHVLLSAPTKAGKTTMMQQLVAKRSHTVVFVSKMKDPTFTKEFKDWTILRDWPKGGPKPYHNKVLLWPKPENDVRDTLRKQQDIFRNALNEILRQGNRCVVIDESLMMNDPKLVGLGTEIGMMHYYGRSAGISMVDLTQRPSWIPRVIYSSVTHAYIASTKDRDDARRLSELGGIDAKEVALNLASPALTRHDYLYLNPLGDSDPVVVNTRK